MIERRPWSMPCSRAGSRCTTSSSSRPLSCVHAGRIPIKAEPPAKAPPLVYPPCVSKGVAMPDPAPDLDRASPRAPQASAVVSGGDGCRPASTTWEAQTALSLSARETARARRPTRAAGSSLRVPVPANVVGPVLRARDERDRNGITGDLAVDRPDSLTDACSQVAQLEAYIVHVGIALRATAPAVDQVSFG